MFKRKIDYNNPNNFNLQLCNEDYYQTKFNNKFPDGYCMILETLSLKKYDDNDVENTINIVRERNKQFNERIEKELAERNKVIEEKEEEKEVKDR